MVKFYTCSFLLVYAFLSTGCAGNALDVYDHQSEKGVVSIQFGNYREMVCCGPKVPKTFFTISQEGDHLVFRKRNDSGKLIASYDLPLLNRVWHAPHWFCLSPDGTKIAYWSKQDNALYVRELNEDNSKVIYRGDKREGYHLYLIAWYDNQTVVTATDPGIDGYDYKDIRKISVDGSIQVARTPYNGLITRLEISPDGNYIGGEISITGKPNPDWSKGSQLMIFNLKTMSECYRSNHFKAETSLGRLSWNGDSKMLFYSSSRRVKGLNLDRIYSFDLDTKKIEIMSPESENLNVGGRVGKEMRFQFNRKKKYYNPLTKRWRDAHDNTPVYTPEIFQTYRSVGE